MPATVATIIAAATKEWEHWGRSSWNLLTGQKQIGHTDDEDAFAQYVVDNYCSVGGGSPSLDDIQDDRYAWSAVCISAIMAAAGHTSAEFPFAQSHSVYIRRFVKARNDNDIGAAYWGRRVNEVAATPQSGDLIGYARGKNMTFEKAQAFFDKTTPYESHTDIVVAQRPGEIDVIGGNVRDSVTKKTIPLTTSGLIMDRSHPWFVVLKRR
ncbi:MAG: DUF2272 domain-containing protein [Rhodospirillales bacterium]|nr:DUF2272 domain-containing protein [Rhodospirillales bacterium]